MNRILLVWEMGDNLGHLSRLLPVARDLASRGHPVVMASRDVPAAREAFARLNVPVIQAPFAVAARQSLGPPQSYADLLWAQGWADTGQLAALTQAWARIFESVSPTVVVLDHSPTALLAARVTGTACVAIGTGFELPPLREPLPAFPGFSTVTAEGAVAAETRVLVNANRALDALGAPKMRALHELFQTERRWLTTFPELDHYGARSAERYIGPIGGVEEGEAIEWPAGYERRVFAYLRPTTPGLPALLAGLATCDASIVCYAPQVKSTLLEPLRRRGAVISRQPVHLRPLLNDASLSLSYAPAGTVASTLLSGTPQLLAPAHLEAQLTAHRVECMGTGLTLRGILGASGFASIFEGMFRRREFRARAHLFAQRYRTFDRQAAIGEIVDDIAGIASHRGAREGTSSGRRIS